VLKYPVTATRVFLIVLDGVGIGEMPDAAEYGDLGSNTLGNLARAMGGLRLPTLASLGLGSIAPIEGVPPAASPLASWGKLRELSKGKDTITGHWEMMGIVSDRPFPTYPEGFPREIMREFERRIGRGTLGNRPASGTAIIETLGAEHIRTGSPIVYTSADSVFQIAAHEDIIPVEELYRICRVARELLVPPHDVCRVIARPFVGPPWERTYRRKDFPLPPPRETALDEIVRAGHEVVSVGKVIDMFGGRGFTGSIRTEGNTDGMAKLSDLVESFQRGLVFANLVDFDSSYGHRNDVAGFARALGEVDLWIAGILPRLGAGDWLILTADHGCDPTTASTDHSREYVPLLIHNPEASPKPLGAAHGFSLVGETVLGLLGLPTMDRPQPGETG
jgi:phosphopentomutase